MLPRSPTAMQLVCVAQLTELRPPGATGGTPAPTSSGTPEVCVFQLSPPSPVAITVRLLPTAKQSLAVGQLIPWTALSASGVQDWLELQTIRVRGSAVSGVSFDQPDPPSVVRRMLPCTPT